MNPDPAPNPAARFITAIVLGATLTPLNSTMIAVALPDIGEAFGVSPSELTLWLVTSYLLVNIILQSPAGKLGDMLGRRRAFAIGQSLFAIGALIASFAPNLSALVVSRILMAAGGAMIIPNAMALLRDVIEEQMRARAFGYFGALLSASAAIGPLVGGVLTLHFGWQAIFLVNLPILLLSWALVKSDSGYALERPQNVNPHPGFDFTGMGLLAMSLGVLVIGLKGDNYWPLVAALTGAFGLYLFTLWERRASHPLIDLELFRRVPFVVGGSVVGLQNLGMYALLFQLPFLLNTGYSLGPGEIGQILLTMTLFMVLFSPVGGRLSESIGARSTVISGLVVSIVGMLVLLITTGSASLLGMSLALALVGAGIGIVSGPAQAAALSVVPASQSGMAAGVLSTMRYVGGIAGIAVISVIITDTDADGMLQQNLSCFGIYLGVYVFALLLAFTLPGRSRIDA